MARIGIQLMMLKDHVAEQGVTQVLTRVRDLGFHTVEVSQIPMTEDNVVSLERAREDLGIRYAAISGSIARTSSAYGLREDLDEHIAHARRLGTDKIRIGIMPLSALRDEESFRAFTREVDDLARRAADQGISLSYHNHHIEFAKVDGTTILDRIREQAPHLRFEIDCHWVTRGGYDAERTLKAFDGVLDLVHLKDFRIAPVPLGVLDGTEDLLEFWERSIVQFAEVGQGNLDWRPVIEQGIASGASDLLIEQDRTYGRDIYDSLAISREHLVELGYRDLIEA